MAILSCYTCVFFNVYPGAMPWPIDFHCRCITIDTVIEGQAKIIFHEKLESVTNVI